MNLTVGPLPPAVYWRRRALVLGVVLLLVILLVSMCGGSSGASKSRQGLASSSATSSPSPSSSVEPPILGGNGSGGSGSGGDGSGGDGSAGAGSGGAANPTANPTATGAATTTGSGAGSGQATAGAGTDPSLCTDAEIQLTPVIQAIRGGNYPYQLTLKIKNVSTRTCKRDVGSGPQELHITDTAGHVLWSSDYCPNGGAATDVRSFGANIEDSFWLPWDGYGDRPGCGKGAKLAPGGYQVVAKLGSKTSSPVGFTVKPDAPVGS
ncbi:hypothetical protein GCM10023322_83650 [Rugosimonospora acidiphila]|uniref:Uncharacterized protein n=1 Tax=Rugosimonospora acidiphila TaxID=556531 RepID=A0ABP9SVR2_9ACTN